MNIEDYFIPVNGNVNGGADVVIAHEASNQYQYVIVPFYVGMVHISHEGVRFGDI